MAFMKRIMLFMAVNLVIVLTVSLLLNVLGVKPYLGRYGLNVGSLAVFCLVWGMGGAFISLGLSRVMAKMMMGVKVIPPDTSDATLSGLVQTVHGLARSANLPAMPEVGIYDSPEVNAFATGPTKSRSLVAVSTGLLSRMSKEEASAVLAHEISHVANGDMVTMTLVQGIVNAFVMFMARLLAYVVSMAGRDRDEDRGVPFSYYLLQMLFEVVFMILGSILVAAFSRRREFRADAGSAKLYGRRQMVAALQALQRTYGLVDRAHEAPALATLKISGHPAGLSRFMALFSTHPPLEERIARLQSMTEHS
jgi:heat shock protein HtpX